MWVIDAIDIVDAVCPRRHMILSSGSMDHRRRLNAVRILRDSVRPKLAGRGNRQRR